MVDVSRETPPTPDEARGAFSPQRLPLAERYVGWLSGAGVERGLIGPRETPRLWDRHVLNCAAISPAFPPESSVGDLGAGAGLPGLVLAVARPDLAVTLVEPLLRRSTFLTEVAEDLGLTNVEVVRARAEELHGQRRFDVVTSRAVAPLERLLRWSMPLVAGTGALVAMKGSSAQEEIDALPGLWDEAGLTEPEVLTLGEGSSTAMVVRVTWVDPGRVSWPFVAGGSGRAGSSRKRRRPRRPRS